MGIFWSKNTIIAPFSLVLAFGPFLALFGPFLTLSDAKHHCVPPRRKKICQIVIDTLADRRAPKKLIWPWHKVPEVKL